MKHGDGSFVVTFSGNSKRLAELKQEKPNLLVSAELLDKLQKY